jgi:hypothetical protein
LDVIESNEAFDAQACTVARVGALVVIEDRSVGIEVARDDAIELEPAQ